MTLDKDIRNNILQILVAMGSTVFSIAVVVCALLVSGNVFDLTKGRNYSDVGVPMYANSGGAALLGLITYVLIVTVVPIILLKIKRSKIFLYAYCVINFFPLVMAFFIFMLLRS